MELTTIKGAGTKVISLLNQLNVYQVEDLVQFYPYRYDILEPTKLSCCDTNGNVVINAIVETEAKVSYIRRNFNSLRFRALHENKIINVSIFNRAFLKPNLKVGQEITLIGKYDDKKNNFVANDIKLTKIEQVKISPVYHLVKGLKVLNIEKLLQEVLRNTFSVPDYIPQAFQETYHFISKKEAIQKIHFPQSAQDIKMARLRLVYEELFLFMFQILYLKKKETTAKGLARFFDKQQVYEFIEKLPFSLTEDQLKAVEDGLEDLSTDKRMNRLLLGDVGSGKTIVATILMYANCLSGYQSVLMAPTEILATQHFLSIVNLFQDYPVHVELFVGSMPAKQKKDVMNKIELGQVDFVIGTHALLNEKVNFANLGFVVTDEQHRFGVNQRKMLQNKGFRSDILYMSATPIPRTYALTIYGDMDTSMIQTKPNGRKSIITKVKKESELKEVLRAVLTEIKSGHQVYVVAPLIEENEENDQLKDVNLLKEKFDLAFQGKVPIGVLHGKLKNQEKDAIMNDFKENKTKILISTTVIEVGVDVKNATMMIIFNAERFGLATLHQLRGRVGRNDLQSYCYLICNMDIERLKVLEESNDGFYISEKDFELRGQGDLFGVQQSGDMGFKIADLKRDYKILLQAKKDADSFIENEEYLHSAIYMEYVKQMMFLN